VRAEINTNLLCTLYAGFTRNVIESRVAGWQIHASSTRQSMKSICAVLGFFLLVGLLILRIVEEQRREEKRTEIEDPLVSRSVEGRTASRTTVETRCSTASPRVTMQRTT